MIRTAAVVIAAAVLGLSSCSRDPGAAAARPAPVTHTIVIEAMRFQPDHLTIRRGDAVLWVNKDLVPHTATSRAPGFDSQLIEAGKSWQLRPERDGEFPYVCAYHPTMTATLRVE